MTAGKSEINTPTTTQTRRQRHRPPSPTRSLPFTNNNTCTTVGVIQSFPPPYKPFYPNHLHNRMTGCFTTVLSYVLTSLLRPRHQLRHLQTPPFQPLLHDPLPCRRKSFLKIMPGTQIFNIQKTRFLTPSQLIPQSDSRLSESSVPAKSRIVKTMRDVDK